MLGGLPEQAQRQNRTRALPLRFQMEEPFGYVVLKPGPLLKALVPRFLREITVATWTSKCESRQKAETKQRPVYAPC